MKTKIKIITIMLFAMLFLSCRSTPSVIDKKEYKIIDTLNVSRNGFGSILGYDIVIKLQDSTLHYASMNTSNNITYVNVISIKKLKEK